MSTATITKASHEWATRPNDQRFLSLEDLRASVAKRKEESWTHAVEPTAIKVGQWEDGGLRIAVHDRYRETVVEPSHWAFGQLAQVAGVPANYARKLPAPLAAVNLEYGLAHFADRDRSLVYARSEPGQPSKLAALTSTTYGRIYDLQVVDAVQRVNRDGQWVIPSATYSRTDPRRATTLYASDRDVFIFLVDPGHPIQLPGQDQPSYRGFFAWNSEVGATTFGLTTFLYERVCDNRIVWGASDVQNLTIRHTRGAPERFAREGRDLLKRYSEESDQAIVKTVEAAQAKSIGKDTASVTEWLASKGFTVSVAKRAVEHAVQEEGGAGTLWQAVQGLTAMARSIEHTDARVDLETRAGKLLAEVR